MRSKKNKKIFPIGLVAFVFVLGFFKAGMLSASMMVDWRAFLFLLGLDSFYLATLLLVGIFHGFARNNTVRRLFWLVLVFLTVTYLIDSFVVIALNESAALFDMGRLALEPHILISFFGTTSYIAMVILLVSMFINTAFRHNLRKFSYALLILTVSASVLSILYAPSPLTRYAMLSPLEFWEIIEAERTSEIYSGKQLELYSRLAQTSVSAP